MTAAVYAIRNLNDMKMYVGSSVKPDLRKIRHWYHLRHGKHVNAHLQRAWIRDGEHAFVFSILEVVDDPSILSEREQWWLNHLTPYELYGYNLSKDTKRPALGQIPWNKGVSPSDDTRQKISESNRGQPGSMKGKCHSDETKRKISEALQGRVVTEEHRKKIGEALKGKTRNNWQWVGKKHTDEARAKISAARIGQVNWCKLTDEDVQEIRDLLAIGMSGMSIAKRFNVAKITVCRIRDGKSHIRSV